MLSIQTTAPTNEVDYSTLSVSFISAMLAHTRFDNGAIFDSPIYAPKLVGKYFNNRNMLRKVIAQNLQMIRMSSIEVRSDVELFIELLHKTERVMILITDDTILNSADVFETCLLLYPRRSCLDDMGDRLRNDSNFALRILLNRSLIYNSFLLHHFGQLVRNDKQLFLKLVKIYPRLLMYASTEISNDLDVINASIDALGKVDDSGCGRLISPGCGRLISPDRKLVCIWNYWIYVGCIAKQNIKLAMHAMYVGKTDFNMIHIMGDNMNDFEFVSCAIEYADCPDIDFFGKSLRTNSNIILLMFLKTIKPKPHPSLVKFQARGYSIRDTIVCLRLGV